jgi:hypothetical protein
MSTIEEKSQVISISPIARRIKRELQNMKKCEIFCDDSDITIAQYNNADFYLTIKNNKDNRLYRFTIPSNYPFTPPKLEINYKPYSYYLRFQSEKFRELINKYKNRDCFCCDSLLCSNNWAPQITLNMIMNEVDNYHKECKEIADRVIVNVIKRKYLIDDVNILEWLY